jgi:CRISPR-associated protein Cas2
MRIPKRIKRFVVIYDICTVDDSYHEIRNAAKRRAKLSRILFEFGGRTQLSVFEVEVGSTQFKGLVERLKSVIREKTDKVYIYPLDEKSLKAIERIGKSSLPFDDIFI